MGDGKVVYIIQIDDSHVEKESEAAGRKAGDGVEKGARGGTSAFKEMMIGAARAIGEAFVNMAKNAVQGVEQIAKAGIDFNAKMEQYQTGLTTLLGSEEQALSAMEQIRKDAASTPFDVDSLTQANQMLISTGMSAGDARKDVLNLANAIAATGGGSAELSRMAANMQQVKNVGKATAMDIRQFAMAGINIYGLLADATGKTTEEVKDMEVSYELLSEALAKAAEEGGKYAGAMEAQSQTFNGQLSTMKDNAMQLAGTLMSDLFSTLSTDALPRLKGYLDALLTAAESGGVEGAVKIAKVILKNLLREFLDALPQMADSGMKLLISVIDGINASLPEIGETALEVLGTLLQALIDNAPDLLVSGFELVANIIAGLLDHADDIFLAAIDLLGQLLQGLSDPKNQERLKSAGRKVVDTILTGIKNAWHTLSGWITDAWNDIKSIFAHPIEVMINGVNNMASGGDYNVPGVGGFASGLNYVPADNFPAFLHKGEAVLTASQASAWRTGLEQSASGSMAQAAGMSAQIIVPLYLNDHEIARASAWAMGEQLAWEEM